MDRVTWLRTLCHKNGLRISDEQLHTMQRYVDLLLGWNKRVNLISRRDEANVWERHILHSLAALFKLELRPSAHVLDLGAGGGLPGIPIKIVLDGLELTCLDSVRKKTVALEDIVQELPLRVRIVCGRAEEVGNRNEFRSRFDYVLCRAVGSLKQLVRWSEPFLKRSAQTEEVKGDHASGLRFPVPSGCLIAWKGGELEAEIGSSRTNQTVQWVRRFPIVLQGTTLLEQSAKELIVIQMSGDG